MTIAKNLAHRAVATRGAAKKLIGRATGNNRLRAEGLIDQFTGNVKQLGDKARHAMKRYPRY